MLRQKEEHQTSTESSRCHLIEGWKGNKEQDAKHKRQNDLRLL